MKSMCQEARRNSPSVADWSPTSSCIVTAPGISWSSIARSSSAGMRPAAKSSRAWSSRFGRSRLPTWSARNGGLVRRDMEDPTSHWLGQTLSGDGLERAGGAGPFAEDPHHHRDGRVTGARHDDGDVPGGREDAAEHVVVLGVAGGGEAGTAAQPVLAGPAQVGAGAAAVLHEPALHVLLAEARGGQQLGVLGAQHHARRGVL